jgi:hypothetical protein
MSAQERLRLRLMNHSALQMREVVGGRKALEMVGISKFDPFVAAASWLEIWFSNIIVVCAGSGFRVL